MQSIMVHPNQYIYDRYKQKNLGYPRLKKLFPSIVIKPQKAHPLVIKNPPIEGMIKKLTLEEKQKAIKDFIDFKKIDELILQGDDELRITEVAFRTLPCHIDYGLRQVLHGFFCSSSIKKMTYLESNFIIGTLLTAYENFYPFTQIDILVLEVGIPSQATTSASSSLTTIPDIGSSSQASTSTRSSQMTIPEIGSTSEANSSTPPRLSENQRSTINLTVMMSIFVASSVLMGYTTKIDKSIGILIESINEVYRDLFSLEYDDIPLEYQLVSSFEFDSHQQLVLSGNDPYGDIDSQAFMVSSAASKDELVLLGMKDDIAQDVDDLSTERWECYPDNQGYKRILHSKFFASPVVLLAFLYIPHRLQLSFEPILRRSRKSQSLGTVKLHKVGANLQGISLPFKLRQLFTRDSVDCSPIIRSMALVTSATGSLLRAHGFSSFEGLTYSGIFGSRLLFQLPEAFPRLLISGYLGLRIGVLILLPRLLVEEKYRSNLVPAFFDFEKDPFKVDSKKSLLQYSGVVDNYKRLFIMTILNLFKYCYWILLRRKDTPVLYD
ncbi:hypothetical protein Tco_0084947 [Tanacetum coccineum]